MAGVLVDTLQQTLLDVALISGLDVVSSIDTMELLSAEDSIIELGASANDTPDDVWQWNGRVVGAAATPSAMMMRLVAKSASDAWLELVLPSLLENAANAVPLALEVDLGNGSWESSLIPTQPNVPDDKVTLDLVLAWTT